MTTSENLFALIKSLNKSEKGYFKKYSGLHVRSGKNIYMLLFDAIDKQRHYDEDAIKKRFHNKPFIRQLTFTKNYLYNLILKSMRGYHSQRLVGIQLKEMLIDIAFLFEKGLYKQCEKNISRAKKIAEQYEYYSSLVELLRWENKLMYAVAFSGKTENDVKHLFEKIFTINDKEKNLNEYAFAESLMFVRVQKKGAARKESDISIYKEIIDNPIFHAEQKMQSYQARLSYYLCYSVYFQMQHEHEKALSYMQKYIQLLEQHPHQITEQQNQYITALMNLLTDQFNCKRYKEMVLTIKKLRDFPTIKRTSSEHIKGNVLYSTNIMELAMYRDTGQFEKGIKLIKNMQYELSIRLNKIINKEDEMLFCFIASCVYFEAEDYTTANLYINKILNAPLIDIRDDLYCFTKILGLLIQIETGKEDILEYTVKSAYRFLYKRNRLYQFETIVLNFIRKKLPKVNPNTSGLLSAYKKLKSELDGVMKNPFEQKVLEYFDFISWLESKIEKRTFAEVVREKCLS